jgi:hypothetical protein
MLAHPTLQRPGILRFRRCYRVPGLAGAGALAAGDTSILLFEFLLAWQSTGGPGKCVYCAIEERHNEAAYKGERDQTETNGHPGACGSVIVNERKDT